MINTLRFVVALALLRLLCFHEAHASDEIKNRIQHSEAFFPDYGSQQLKIGKQDLIITRGLYKIGGTAWGGDIFTLLVKEEAEWDIVSLESNTVTSPLLTTRPHTFEDSLSTLRFLKPKHERRNRGYPLYLLTASREYIPDDFSTQVSFKLYELGKDEDFDRPLLFLVGERTTVKRYCNVDWALYKELSVPLPNDGHDYANCPSAMVKKHEE